MCLLLPSIETSVCWFLFCCFYWAMKWICLQGITLSYINLDFPWECSCSNQKSKFSKLTIINYSAASQHGPVVFRECQNNVLFSCSSLDHSAHTVTCYTHNLHLKNWNRTLRKVNLLEKNRYCLITSVWDVSTLPLGKKKWQTSAAIFFSPHEWLEFITIATINIVWDFKCVLGWLQLEIFYLTILPLPQQFSIPQVTIALLVSFEFKNVLTRSDVPPVTVVADFPSMAVRVLSKGGSALFSLVCNSHRSHVSRSKSGHIWEE